MKNILFALLLISGSSAFAETFKCPDGDIVIENEKATLYGWGPRAETISSPYMARAENKIIIFLGGSNANTIYLNYFKKNIYKYDYIVDEPENSRRKCYMVSNK